MGGLSSLFRRGSRIRVRMINSVDEYVAGEQYDLPSDLADRFILRGYASGELSRNYSVDERAAMSANHQEVRIGG